MSSTPFPPSGSSPGPTAGRSPDPRPDPRSDRAAGPSDEARRAGAAASDLMSEAADRARGEAAALTERARAEAMDQAERGKAAGADAVRQVADATRAAAESLAETQPRMALYAREAAGMVDEVSEAIRTRSTSDLVRSVDRFARREPVAFFGAALAAGFVAARFLGSSARHDHPAEAAASRHRDTGPFGRGAAGTPSGLSTGVASAPSPSVTPSPSPSPAAGAGVGHRPSSTFSPTPKTDGPDAFGGRPQTRVAAAEPVRSAGLPPASEAPTPRPSAADSLGRPASGVGDGAPSGTSGTPGATPDRSLT